MVIASKNLDWNGENMVPILVKIWDKEMGRKGDEVRWRDKMLPNTWMLDIIKTDHSDRLNIIPPLYLVVMRTWYIPGIC